MATTIGNEYEHIDFTHNNITTRHPIKDATARSMVGDIVKISDSDPQLPNNKIWIKETPNAEVQVPTYEEFEEVKAYAYRNKNLIDPAKASSGISDYIPIDSETRYVLTHKDRGSGNFSFTLYTYDANKANMQMSFIELTAGEYEKFLTFNTGRAYLKITVSSAPDSIDRTDISRVYLGKFSDGQSFVPYHYSVDEQIDNRGYYTKPVSGIPGSDIASGVIPVLTDLIDDTAGVGDSTKVWSADKSATEHNTLLSAINATKTNLIGESDKQSRQRSITGLVANPTNGFYKVSNGQFAESDSYRTYEYALPNGTNRYNLSIYQRGNGANDGIYYVYMAYDESNNLIDYRTQTVVTQQLSIVVPDNAVKIIYTKENVASNSCMMTWKTSAFDHINALERNIAVFIGDSYVGGNSLGTDVDKRFSTVLSNRMGWVEKNFAVGGMGYVYGNTTFEDQIDNAVADNTYNHDDVKYVLICGGRNDGGTYPYMDATLTTAVQSAITAAKTGFPNATVIVVPMLWDYQYISRAIYPLYQTIIYAAQTLDAVVIPNAYTWLTGMKGMILSDGVHPNVTGHAIIASHIENALTTGNSFAFPSSRVLSPVSESIDGSATNYFTITQENGLIHFDAEFKLSAGVSANSILFSLTVANNENVPAYTGNYERFLVVQKSDGALATLSVTTTIADGGYTIIAKAVTALSAGTYYMDGEFIPFALQRFASWRS